ncbi:hypothetical protein LOAG_07531 [Loa loa]|uniref:Uncharacterized protein n=1 Tax=Loa loa TaxID=7209 RepID=A0A1S0TXA5_LOALO|nr:hypothetical protein LOAG_07531 [Loa loa]EFO20961.1 hypothetical protein LOAG_07531 [Loa loa]
MDELSPSYEIKNLHLKQVLHHLVKCKNMLLKYRISDNWGSREVERTGQETGREKLNLWNQVNHHLEFSLFVMNCCLIKFSIELWKCLGKNPRKTLAAKAKKADGVTWRNAINNRFVLMEKGIDDDVICIHYMARIFLSPSDDFQRYCDIVSRSYFDQAISEREYTIKKAEKENIENLGSSRIVPGSPLLRAVLIADCSPTWCPRESFPDLGQISWEFKIFANFGCFGPYMSC